MYYLNSIWNATYSCYVICLWIYYIWLYMYTIFFSLLSVDGHVGWFHNLAVNITAMIMSTKISLTYWFQTLWLATQKWDCWSNGNSIYSVWGNLHSFTFLAAVLKGSFSCVLTHIYFFPSFWQQPFWQHSLRKPGSRGKFLVIVHPGKQLLMVQVVEFLLATREI